MPQSHLVLHGEAALSQLSAASLLENRLVWVLARALEVEVLMPGDKPFVTAPTAGAGGHKALTASRGMEKQLTKGKSSLMLRGCRGTDVLTDLVRGWLFSSN